MKIVKINPDFRAAVSEAVKDEFSGPMMVSRGEVYDTTVLPGFVAVDDDNDFCGTSLYRLVDNDCEIVVLLSRRENQGVGTSLINTMFDTAKAAHCRRLWLITTNDNTRAIRFYQKRGFSLKAVHINALNKSRELKPSIPLVGNEGIPLLHEFEFEIVL